MIKRIYFTVSLLALSSFGGVCVSAADVKVVAALDRSMVEVNGRASFTVKILDGRGNIQAPQPPRLKDLAIHYTGRASRMTLINGVSSSSVEFSYIVSPMKTGGYTIPAFSVSVDGVLFQTNPVEFEAVDSIAPRSSSVGSPYPAQSGGAQPVNNQASPGAVTSSSSQPPVGADSRIYAEAQLSKLSVYQNEQVLLSYELYTSYDTRYEGFETEPELSGFWIEEFPLEKDVPRNMVTIGGRRYIKADIKKTALFPTSPGKYTIQPGKIKTTVKQDQQQDNVFDEFFNDSFFNGGNFFSKRETRILAPKVLNIEVKPLPEAGKPANFLGDVGLYKMSSNLDHSKVKQNEPVKMTLVIEGMGNVDRVSRPRIPDLKGFRTYEADSKSEVSRVNDMISGRKTFEIVFIPREEGKMFIPPLEFSFFDPVQGKYETLRTPNYALTVLKGDAGPALPDEVTTQNDLKKDVQVDSKDIRYIETRLPAEKNWDKASRWVLPVLAVSNLFSLVLIGLFAVQKKRESFISKNRGLYRNQRARSVAMSEINTLKKLARKKDLSSQTKFFEFLERCLNQYFADKWNLSAQGTARSEIDRRMNEVFGSNDPLCQEVSGVYQLCDESRFGRGSIPESSKELAVRVVLGVINRLEQMK